MRAGANRRAILTMIDFLNLFCSAIFEFFTQFIVSDPFLVFCLSSVFCVSVYGILFSFMGVRSK